MEGRAEGKKGWRRREGGKDGGKEKGRREEGDKEKGRQKNEIGVASLSHH